MEDIPIIVMRKCIAKIDHIDPYLCIIDISCLECLSNCFFWWCDLESFFFEKVFECLPSQFQCELKSLDKPTLFELVESILSHCLGETLQCLRKMRKTLMRSYILIHRGNIWFIMRKSIKKSPSRSVGIKRIYSLWGDFYVLSFSSLPRESDVYCTSVCFTRKTSFCIEVIFLFGTSVCIESNNALYVYVYEFGNSIGIIDQDSEGGEWSSPCLVK